MTEIKGLEEREGGGGRERGEGGERELWNTDEWQKKRYVSINKQLRYPVSVLLFYSILHLHGHLSPITSTP